jgi:hypothetical protein
MRHPPGAIERLALVRRSRKKKRMRESLAGKRSGCVQVLGWCCRPARHGCVLCDNLDKLDPKKNAPTPTCTLEERPPITVIDCMESYFHQ